MDQPARLVLIEGSWGGRGASALDQLRQRARALTDLIRQPEPDHHAHYTERMRSLRCRPR